MNAPSRFVATIGVFDGVHLGHQLLIATTRRLAAELSMAGRPVDVMLLTFDPHPAAVLAPGRVTPSLTPTAEKLRLIRTLGIESVRVLRFDREMAALAPEEFIDRVLDPERRLVQLVIGHDFALGRDRTGDAARLGRIGAARGFEVTRLSALRQRGEVISSSRIREAVQAGDLERAHGFLGRRYSIEGGVGPGDGRGRTLGFPTANVALPSDKLAPPTGVYAVRVSGDRLTEHPAVMNYGRRPTFGGGELVAEVHLLDYEGNLTGQLLQVTLVQRLRDERRFATPADLKAQILTDVAAARAALSR